MYTIGYANIIPSNKRKVVPSSDNNQSVKLLIGNTYNPIPYSEAELDNRTKTHRKIHDWTLYVDVVDGNPDIIDCCKFELPTFQPNVFTCSTPIPIYRNNGKKVWRFHTRQQSYGSITAKLTIHGVGGSVATYSHSLILSDSKLQRITSPSLIDFCEENAPRPMKMIRLPENQKFGLELELSSAANWDHQSIADAIESNDCPIDVMGYASGRATSENWKIVPDSSIACSRSLPDCNKFELVSPILYGGPGLNSIHGILQKLNNLQPKLKVNKSMGFHVHIDVSNFEMDQLVKICQNFIKYEALMDTFMPPSRRNGSSESNQYFKSNRNSVSRNDPTMTNKECHKILSQCTNIFSLVQVMNRDGRYYKLNLTNLTNFNGRYQPTIEFRQHSASLKYDKIGAWIRFCVAFCNNSARLAPPSSFRENKTLKDQFDALFQYVIKDRALRDFYKKRQKELLEQHIEGVDDSDDACCTGCEDGGDGCKGF